MKNRFNLINSIIAKPWHMHQASAMGLMPLVVQLINGELKSEFDDENIIPEGIKPSAVRSIANYERFKSEAYVSERDTWYYEDFPIKLDGGILMIPVVGAIFQEDFWGTAGTRTIGSWYDKALNDPEIKAIIEYKNTPGGSVFGTRGLANKKVNFGLKKPIVGFADGMECSAGLYIGAPDHYKIIAPDSIIGSCGVMTTFADWSAWYKEHGVELIDLYSKTSPLKNDAYRRAMKGDFKGYTDGILFKFDQSFMAFMKEQSPGISKTALQGADFVAEEGVEHGLAHAVGSFDDAYAKALEFAANPSLASKQKSNNTMSKKIMMAVPAAAAALLKMLGATEAQEDTQEQENQDNQDNPEEETEKPEAGAKTTTLAAAQAPAQPDANAKKIADLEATVKKQAADFKKQTADFEAFKAAAGKDNPAAQRSAARAQEAEKTPEENEAKASAKMEGEDAFMAQFYMMK